MAKGKPALGSGLGALIGAKQRREKSKPAKSDTSKDKSGDRGVEEVKIDRLQPSSLQPRREFDDSALEELVESIREHGVIQPLIVREKPDHLELIAGERRWRACQILKLKKVPVIRREASDQEVLEMALIENIQREDLNPIEEAEAYQRLAKEFKLRQNDIAKRVGKSRAAVANAMRLVDLDDEVKSHLKHGRITIGHAKVLLGLKEKSDQRETASEILRKNLTVRDTEKIVESIRNPVATGKTRVGGKQLKPSLAHVENLLRESFSTQVKLRHKPKKGRIEIEYYGEDDLQRLLDLWGVSDDDQR